MIFSYSAWSRTGELQSLVASMRGKGQVVTMTFKSLLTNYSTHLVIELTLQRHPKFSPLLFLQNPTNPTAPPDTSLLNIQHCTLHPQLRVLLMCPQHKTPILHRRLASCALPEALVEDALEPKLGEALLRVQDGRDLEEPI